MGAAEGVGRENCRGEEVLFAFVSFWSDDFCSGWIGRYGYAECGEKLISGWRHVVTGLSHNVVIYVTLLRSNSGRFEVDFKKSR